MRPTQIVHPLIVILGDVVEGGAATSTGRLIDALTANGLRVERWHFSRQPRSAPAHYVSLDDRRKRPPVERVAKNLSRPIADAMRRARHEAAFFAAVQQRRPALINVRNIHDCGLNHDSLLRLPKDLPLVWTMHDAWPFHVHAFEWWNSAVGRTETTASDGPTLTSAAARRQRFFKMRPDVVLASPSRWLADEARRAVPTSVRVEVLPNGLPTEVFHPQDKAAAKATLGLDPRRAWLGFASTWANSRKGTDVFVRALHQLPVAGLGLVSWGGELGGQFPEGLPVQHFGNIAHERLSALLYRAADLFVCPSRADNLPNTVLESLACGTPVVGSRIGGIPDMVQPGRTGWLYEQDVPEECAAALATALRARADWPQLQAGARALVEAEFSVTRAAERYTALYRDLLAGRPAAR